MPLSALFVAVRSQSVSSMEPVPSMQTPSDWLETSVAPVTLNYVSSYAKIGSLKKFVDE